jgi:ABC-type oligopeptide transport system substrate-binding subunit
MARISFRQFRVVLVLVVLSSFLVSCSSSANSRFWGKTQPPKENVLRYVSGPEPESLDPQIPSGQPEARVSMALFEGLVEYDPKDQQPIPAIAERWETASNVDEFLFYLRKNAKWSDGKPITAKDFVYSFRRGFRPETLSRTASLGYFITYSEAFNGKQFFVKKNGNFVTLNDVAEKPAEAKSVQPFGAETEFRKFIKSPERITLPNDPLKRAQAIEANPKLKEVFKFAPADLKNAPALATKIKGGENELMKFLAANLPAEALACSDANACSDAAKQSLADGLNKIIDGDSLFAKDWFAQVPISESSKKLSDAITAENKKRGDANAKIDEEIATLEDPAKKAEKEKTKKKPLGKLLYANKFLLEQSFPEEIAASDLVLVKAEDIGVEAVDDYTVRISLRQPAPFFLGLLAHQFFRLVPEQSVEKHGRNWTRPENIVTCGAFKVKNHYPYDVLVVEKDPNYWDAPNVHLDRIEFVAVEDQFTRLNLYKSGEVDAILNHSVPSSWIDEIRQYKDEYLDFPENATSYYSFNVRKPPFDNQKVRQAFHEAIDRDTLSQSRKVTKPLYYYTPTGIFPDYDKAMEKVGEEFRKERNIAPEEWAKRNEFNAERARKLLTEAGYPVQKSGSGWSCPTFPADKVALTFNTNESNRQIAEFVQAQWKQNLGVTIPLKNMEFKTFLPMRNALQYDGMAQSLWSGDYMDPFTFLGLHYGFPNDGGSGFQDEKYDKMLDEANAELDPQKRYEKMARAEYYVKEQMPATPLTINATNWLKKPFIKGLYPNPGTLHPWKFVYIERDPNKWDKDAKNLMTEKDPQVEEQLSKLKSTQMQKTANAE